MIKLPFSFLTNWSTTGHLILRIALLAAVFLQLNYLGCTYYQALDLSRNQKFSLSERTTRFLREAGPGVTIITTFLGTSDILPEVNGIVGEYDRVGGDRVELEMLDLSRSRDRIAELRDRYKMDLDREQITVVGENGRIKVVGAEELVTRDPSTGRILEFRGEEKLTSAILEVTEKEQKKVYLVYGSRDFNQLAPIAQQLQVMVNAQNASLENIMLQGRQSIPPDADALIFPGNTTDLTKREAEMVRAFWEERNGGLFILLDPAADTPNLNSILRENGVLPNRDRVLTVRSIPGLGYSKIYHAPVTIMPGFGPNRDLPVMALQLMDRTQSLEIQSSDELYLSKNIRPSPLMLADQSFWGETEFGAEEVSFNPDYDNGQPDPVFTAAAIEKSPQQAVDSRRETSRLVVVGNPNLISPEGNTQKTASDFCMASLNWIMNRDELLGIAPKQPSSYNLFIGSGTFGLLQTLLVWVFPAALLFCGALIWYKRRQ